MRAGISALIALVLAGTASAAPLKQVDRGLIFGPVASPSGEFAAYVKRAGTLVVRGEPGSLGAQTVPDTCIPAAASTHGVALDCFTDPGVVEEILVLDFITGDRVRIAAADLPSDGPIGAPRDLRTVAVGRHWVHVRASGASGKRTDEFVVSLGHDDAIDLADDPFGAHQLLNLNRTPPSRRACKASQRFAGGGGPTSAAAFGVAQGFGHWVLAANGPERYDLVDCRTKRHRTVSTAGPVLLNASHLATVDGSSVTLTQLAPRRVQHLVTDALSDASPQIALSAHVLWVRDGDGRLFKQRL